MTLTKVCEGLDFPEGPIAMADGSTILVEIKRQTLSRVHPDGRIEVIAELGGGPNGAAVGPDGMIYVCNNGGFVWTTQDGITRPIGTPEDYVSGSIQRVDPATGAFETLYDACDGQPCHIGVIGRAQDIELAEETQHRCNEKGGVWCDPLLNNSAQNQMTTFLREGTDPKAACDDLAEAVSLLVERPALEAALAAATARFETDPEGAFTEQQRLLKRKLEFERRLGQMVSERAAKAARSDSDRQTFHSGEDDLETDR